MTQSDKFDALSEEENRGRGRAKPSRAERTVNKCQKMEKGGTSVMVRFREILSGLRLKAVVSNNGAVARGSNT